MSANTLLMEINPVAAEHMLNHKLGDLNKGSTTPLRFPEDLAACEYDPDAMERVKQLINHCEERSNAVGESGVNATTMRFALLSMTHLIPINPPHAGLRMRAHPRLLEQMLIDDPGLVRCYVLNRSYTFLFDFYNRSLLSMDVLLQKGADPRSHNGLDREMITQSRGVEALARAIMRHDEEDLKHLQGWIKQSPDDQEDILSKLDRLKRAIELRPAIKARNEGAYPITALMTASDSIKRPERQKSTADALIYNDGDNSLKRRIAGFLGGSLDPNSERVYAAQKTAYLEWLIPNLTDTIPSYAGRPEHEELTQRLNRARAELDNLRNMPQPPPAAQPGAGGGAPGP